MKQQTAQKVLFCIFIALLGSVQCNFEGMILDKAKPIEGEENKPAVTGDAFNSTMIELNEGNFEKKLGREHDQLLVVFYAPWCPHWQELLPKLDLLDKSFQHHGLGQKVAIIDVSNSARIIEEYAIKAYPTIRWFSKGRHHEYRGRKSVDGMLNWVNDRIIQEEKRSSKVKTCEELDKLTADQSTASSRFILVYFGETYENLYKNIHMQIPDPAGELKLFHIVDYECSKQYKSNYPGMIMIRGFEEKYHPYLSKAPALDNWTEFVRDRMVPTMFEFTEQYIENVFEQNRPTFILFHDEDSGKPDYWFTYKEAAYNNKGLVGFSYVGKTHPYAKTLQMFMNVKPEDYPILTAVRPKDMGKFTFPAHPRDMTVPAMVEWATKIKSDDMKPDVRSQPVPEASSGPVTELVGQNFYEFVTKNETDVFVLYYTNWCQYCNQSLFEKWDAAATHFANDSRIAFAKIDVDNNDLTGTDAQGSPLYEIWPAHMKIQRQDPSTVGDLSAIISSVESYSTHLVKDKKNAEDAKAKELEEEEAAALRASEIQANSTKSEDQAQNKDDEKAEAKVEL